MRLGRIRAGEDRSARLRPIKAHHTHNKPMSPMHTATTIMLPANKNRNNSYNMASASEVAPFVWTEFLASSVKSSRFLPRSLSDIDRSTAANDLRSAASFSARSQEP